MSPGPNTLLVTRNALLVSRREGVYTALGIATGSLVHSTMALLGLSALIAGSPILFRIFKWAGSAYLVYLGIRMLLSKQHKEGVAANPVRSNTLGLSAYRAGLLTNLSNPKSYIFYFALFSNMFNATSPLYLKIIVVIQILLSSITWHTLLALVFSTPRIQSVFTRIMGVLEKIFGTILVLLGIRIAFARM